MEEKAREDDDGQSPSPKSGAASPKDKEGSSKELSETSKDRLKREEQEEQRRLEEERLKEEAARRAQELEARRAQELARAEERKKRRKLAAESNAPPAVLVYREELGSDVATPEIMCIIKTTFYAQDELKVTFINLSELNLSFKEEEELISRPIMVENIFPEDNPEESSASMVAEIITLAVPIYGRMPPTREPVIKIFMHAFWEDCAGVEVTLDGYRQDSRFVQAELDRVGKVCVVSRFKRDHFSISTHQPERVVSSTDSRVTLSIQKKSFEDDPQPLTMIVQPQEAANVADFRQRDSRGKRLLATSPILHTEWDDLEAFRNPVTIVLPCPPSANKTKKVPMASKHVEDSGGDTGATRRASVRPPPPKIAPPPPPTSTDPEQPSRVAPIKWYMGQYADDDEESEDLWLITFLHGKWTVAPNTPIKHVKQDLVTFKLDAPCEKLLVVRVQQGTEEDVMRPMAAGLLEQLGRRQISIFIKQSSDDPYDLVCYLTPSWNAEKLSRTLNEKGYREGPANSRFGFVAEGDTVLLEFQGNIKIDIAQESGRTRSGSSIAESAPITLDKADAKAGEADAEAKAATEMTLIYHSNLLNMARLFVQEKDRYLQRNLDMFRGVIQVVRKTKSAPSKPPPRRFSLKPEHVVKQEVAGLLCQVYIDIPKDHLEIEPVPKRVPFKIPNNATLNDRHLTFVAEELGEEWQELALKLQLTHARIQAVIRLAKASDDKDFYAKYEMLLCWFKGCPLSLDMNNTLANALQAVGRKDLTGIVRTRGWSGLELN